MRTCVVDDCDRKHYGRDLCKLHYDRLRKHGSTALVERRRGPAHHNWRGDAIGYDAVHDRLQVEYGKASERSCADCGLQAAHWAFDEPTGYSTDLTRYRPLCGPCHAIADGKGKYERVA